VLGVWLVDDLELKELGKGSYHNKFGWQAGLGWAMRGDRMVWLEYVRLDPFLYTHRFKLNGSYYNAYQHNGFPLGHPLGPNADQLSVGLQWFGPSYWTMRLKLDYTRRGENYRDASGELVNVGGDLLNGDQPPFSEFTKTFLAGKRVEGMGMETSMTWEPVRGLNFSLYLRFHQWNVEENMYFLRTSLSVQL